MKQYFLSHCSSHWKFPWKGILIRFATSSELKINTAKSARRGARCRGASTASVWHSCRHVQAHRLNKMATAKPHHNQGVPRTSPCQKCESFGHRWSSSPRGSAAGWTIWRHHHHFFVTSPRPPITVYLLHPAPACREQFCFFWCLPVIERLPAPAFLWCLQPTDHLPLWGVSIPLKSCFPEAFANCRDPANPYTIYWENPRILNSSVAEDATPRVSDLKEKF